MNAYWRRNWPEIVFGAGMIGLIAGLLVLAYLPVYVGRTIILVGLGIIVGIYIGRFSVEGWPRRNS